MLFFSPPLLLLSNLMASSVRTLCSHLVPCLFCIYDNYITYTTIIFSPGSSQSFPKGFSSICFHPSPIQSLYRANEIFLKHKWEHTTQLLQNFQWFFPRKERHLTVTQGPVLCDLQQRGNLLSATLHHPTSTSLNFFQLLAQVNLFQPVLLTLLPRMHLLYTQLHFLRGSAEMSAFLDRGDSITWNRSPSSFQCLIFWFLHSHYYNLQLFLFATNLFVAWIHSWNVRSLVQEQRLWFL